MPARRSAESKSGLLDLIKATVHAPGIDDSYAMFTSWERREMRVSQEIVALNFVHLIRSEANNINATELRVKV